MHNTSFWRENTHTIKQQKTCVSKLELELNISMTNTEVHSMSRMNELIQ